jgi:hypothetical protein
MHIRRHLTKSRAGHWTLTLTNVDTGHKAYSDKHDSRHGALTEEDELMARLRALCRPTTNGSPPSAPVATDVSPA